MKEPQDAVILSARLAKAFPSLSAYSAASLAEDLCAIERAQRRHAERCCNGDYRETLNYREGPLHDPEAEERAERRVKRSCERWRDRLRSLTLGAPAASSAMLIARAADLQRTIIDLQGDPRGAVLLLKLPGEEEARAV